MIPQMMPPAAPQEDDDGLFGKVMKDPWFRLGMALLEQAGPQDKPHSIGQDIARAVAGVQSQQDQDVLRKQRNQKLAMMQRTQQMAQGMLGSLGSPEGMGEASGPPAAITPPNVAPQIDPTSNPSPGVRASFKVPEQYEPMLRRASQMYGVPYEILAAQAHHESAGTWDPNIQGTSGELGIPQFMPATAKQYGLIGPQGDMRNNPELSFNAQARFMRDLADKNGGDWGAALHRYNASPGNPMGKKYADKVLSIAGMAPQAADTIDAPAPQAPPTRPQGPAPKIPPELHRMFLAQAYAEGMGDPVATVQAYYKLANAWQMENMKSVSKMTNDFAVEDYKADLARQKAQRDADLKVSGAYDEKQAQLDAEAFNEANKSLPSAMDALDNIKSMRRLLSEGITTGAGAETLQDWKSFFQTMGVSFDEKTAKTDMFRALSGSMLQALRQQQAQAGTKDPNPSNADLQFQQKMIPSLANTPEGNVLLLMQLERQQARNIELTQARQAWTEANGGRYNSSKFMKSKEAADILQKYRLTDQQLKMMAGDAVAEVEAIDPEAVALLRKNPTKEYIQKFNEHFQQYGLAERILGVK